MHWGEKQIDIYSPGKGNIKKPFNDAFCKAI